MKTKERELEASSVGTAATPLVAPEDRAQSTAPDAQQFTELFTRAAPRVLRVLRRFGVRESDLDDLCQEVFVVVYRSLAQFRGDSSIDTWIYGIAARKAMAHRRRKHVRDEVTLEPEQVPEVGAEQSRGLEQRDAQATLSALLDRLDDGKRQVFVLYELEQLGMKEVAAAMDLPLHTAYSRLHAARKQLTAHARRLRNLGAEA
ncbi:MAG: sigma-70 family RNA polymerase sigma factor [Myxococcales bacterium]|nr:sigma-70 family RNA polymerase sigma factor [Myxococcales bacterium]